MVRSATITALLLLGAGCGGESGGDLPAVGTVERFAVITANSEGVVVMTMPSGEPALFVSSPNGNAIHRIDSEGAVTLHADIPSPLGMAAVAEGELIVCAKSVDASGVESGAVWRVEASGAAAIIIGTDDVPGGLSVPNYPALAPDDSLVFSDSNRDLVFRAEVDGSGVAEITAAIHYPNGLAFAPSGDALYVASWLDGIVYRLQLDPSDGSFGPPEPIITDISLVDGVHATSEGDLILVTTGSGVVLAGLDGRRETLAGPEEFDIPTNGAFGQGPYGASWLYVADLLSGSVRRVQTGLEGDRL